MIVLDKPKLKFLKAGRSVTVIVPHDRYRKGRVYSVGLAHNRPATCTCTIKGVKVTATGFELEIVQNREDQPRFLARNPGAQRRDYVTRTADALPDEPEPIDAALQAKYGKEARENDLARRSKQHDETPTVQQLQDLERRAAAGDSQAQRHLFMIKKHLSEAAERKSRDAA